jgi:hypothetical protein
MEAICSSETSVDVQRTTRRCILEDSTLQYFESCVVIISLQNMKINFELFCRLVLIFRCVGRMSDRFFFPYFTKQSFFYVGFEGFTAVVLTSTIILDITPCSPLRSNRRFGGTYRLHLQGRKISWAINQREHSACYLLSRWFLTQLIFRPWIWRRYIPRKCRFTLNELHGVISQQTVLFNLSSRFLYCHPTSEALIGPWCARYMFEPIREPAVRPVVSSAVLMHDVRLC